MPQPQVQLLRELPEHDVPLAGIAVWADAYDVAAMNKAADLAFRSRTECFDDGRCGWSAARAQSVCLYFRGDLCAVGPAARRRQPAVIEMLEGIHRDGLTIDQVLAKAKDRNSKFRLMGFGHRIYKSYDPRARLTKKLCMEMAAKRKINDPLVEIALELEARALADDYFQTRNLYPNVDFYTGLTYRMMGFPKEMFTVLFALGRLPGWIAHWQEMRADSEQKIMRPRQIYVGPQRTEFVRIEARK